MKVDRTESFASMMARAKAAKSGIENEHKLLNERYDLSDRPAQVRYVRVCVYSRVKRRPLRAA
jgi:hypothetical protein